MKAQTVATIWLGLGIVASAWVTGVVRNIESDRLRLLVDAEGRQIDVQVGHEATTLQTALRHMASRLDAAEEFDRESWLTDARRYHEDLPANPVLELWGVDGERLAIVPENLAPAHAGIVAPAPETLSDFPDSTALSGQQRSLLLSREQGLEGAELRLTSPLDAGADELAAVSARFPLKRLVSYWLEGVRDDFALSMTIGEEPVLRVNEPAKSGPSVAYTRQIPFSSGNAEYVLAPTQAYVDRHYRNYALPTLLLCLLLSVLGTIAAYKYVEARELSASRRKELQRARLLLEAIKCSDECINIMDADGRILYVNRAYERHRQCRRGDIVGKTLWELATSLGKEALYSDLRAHFQKGERWSGRVITQLPDGRRVAEETTISPLTDEAGERIGHVAVIRDVTRKETEYRQRAESQRLEALGQLAAGVAHEINTPLQFISDNLHFIETTVGDCTDLLHNLQNMRRRLASLPETFPVSQQLGTILDEADPEFLATEPPKAIRESLDGVKHIAGMIGAIKSFTRTGRGKRPFDLNELVRMTTRAMANEWRFVAQLETDLDPAAADFTGHRSSISQMILKLVENATEAIADDPRKSPADDGRIVVTTRNLGDSIEIRVSDNGPGIDPAIRDRIFDPYFTTKPMGTGTGQGLAYVQQTVVEQHGGTVEVESEPGQGATIIVRLPVEQAAIPEAVAV